MHHGLAARNGFLRRAGLAATATTGIKRVFERDTAIPQCFRRGPSPRRRRAHERFSANDGKRPLMVKSYASDGVGCRAIDAPAVARIGGPKRVAHLASPSAPRSTTRVGGNRGAPVDPDRSTDAPRLHHGSPLLAATCCRTVAPARLDAERHLASSSNRTEVHLDEARAAATSASASHRPRRHHRRRTCIASASTTARRTRRSDHQR